MRGVFLILSVSSFVLGQTTPDQTEGRPKYQRALTDLVPANLITVLDKYHRPITNNYEPPEPTKQKLTKAEILAKFTSARASSTTPSTTSTTTTTTTRKPSTFVTSYPTLGQADGATETPFRILFIQTTTPNPLSAGDSTQPGFFTKVVTQTAKTVTVYEDGVARTETVTPTPSQGTTLTSSPDFSPVFIYKNQRFTSDTPNPVVSVASSVSTSDGEVFKTGEEIKAQSIGELQKALTTPLKSSSTPRPRRKVIKVKSRKIVKNEKENRKTTEKPSAEPTKPASEASKKKEALPARGSKPNVQRERPKVLITRRLTNPQKSQNLEVSTTEAPRPETTTEAPKKIRRPGGIRRSTAAPEPEKPTSEAPVTTASPVRPLFRTRVAVPPSRAPTTPTSTQRSVTPSTTPAQLAPTKTPSRRTTQLSRTSPATSSSTLSNTRLPETSTTSAQTSAVSEARPSTKRLSQKRVVTRIGTSRPIAVNSQTTPLPETPTAAPVTTEPPAASRNPKKVVKRKKKPAVSTSTPDSISSERTTVTPVSIIYFQTTRFTTPAPAVTEARRVPKKRRRKPSTPAGTVSTQPIPFTATEPSTFSAPQAVTGFRPISTPNYFATPEHLQHLPKTDEIAQVINLPGGRLSSYQARYSPPRPQDTFLSSQEYDAPIRNPLPQQIPRLSQNQRAIRPGPFTVDEFFANDPSYQDLQRLLVAETNRFHSQPRNSARFSPYPDRAVEYRSSK